MRGSLIVQRGLLSAGAESAGAQSGGTGTGGGHFIDLAREESIEIFRGRNNINFIDLIGNSFHESLCKKMCKPIK